MGLAVPLRVDVKELTPFVVAVKAPPGPHVDVAPAVLGVREHSLLPPTLQMVIRFMSPVTVHLKVKVSPGQVGGAAVNCPAAPPACSIKLNNDLHKLCFLDQTLRLFVLLHISTHFKSV